MKEFNDIVTINQTKIGEGFPPYIIAEMACAHNGDVEQAIKITEAAYKAGANAIQLQFFNLSEVVTPTHEVFPTIKKICFDEEQWKKVHDYASSLNIDLLVCTYDLPSVELAVKLGVHGIKLNSADLSNPEVVEAAAKTKLPITLGTGASTMEEISNGLNLIRNNGGKDVILMQGVQNFPTKTEDLNISRIKLLQNVFEMPVGYHDHTDGDDSFGQVIDLIALGMGACVIEKHITLDRSMKGVDYQAALEPDEFKVFVDNLKRGTVALGSNEIKPFNESDLKYRKFQKKSVVAIRDIDKGETINRTDVMFARNETPGLAPINFDQLEGKKAQEAINKFDNILPENVV